MFRFTIRDVPWLKIPAAERRSPQPTATLWGGLQPRSGDTSLPPLRGLGRAFGFATHGASVGSGLLPLRGREDYNTDMRYRLRTLLNCAGLGAAGDLGLLACGCECTLGGGVVRAVQRGCVSHPQRQRPGSRFAGAPESAGASEDGVRQAVTVARVVLGGDTRCSATSSARC